MTGLLYSAVVRNKTNDDNMHRKLLYKRGFFYTGIFLITGSVFFIFFISVRQSISINETAGLINRTQKQVQYAQGLTLAAVDNESGARGYVITKNADFLDQINKSQRSFQQHLKQLQTLLRNDTALRSLMDTVSGNVNLRIAYSDSLIRARQLLPALVAVQMIESGTGKRYTDAIRSGAGRIETIILDRLQVQKDKNVSNVRSLNILLYTVLSVTYLLSMIMIFRVRREVRQREAGERKFQAMLQAAPDATVITDERGMIRMINQQTEKLFGYGRGEMLDQPVEMLIPAELHTAHQHHRNSFMKKASLREMGAGLELYAVRKGDQQFPVEISLSPIHTDEGMMVIASVRDITHRKKLENELRRSNAELDAFTYSVSHDLRAPLRGIVGFTSILEEDYGNKFDEEGRRITGIIRANTLKMGHLIDDLLSFSRLGRQELQKTALQTEDQVQEVIREVDPEQKVRWTIGPLPVVHADIKTLRQVWINLLSNAVKYSSQKEVPAITVGHYFNNNEEVFYVKDNGVGFDIKYRDKLFRVFQRLHSADEFEGTGVGLALVEKIISRHGGRVWAEGVVGEGACFYFSLPKG